MTHTIAGLLRVHAGLDTRTQAPGLSSGPFDQAPVLLWRTCWKCHFCRSGLEQCPPRAVRALAMGVAAIGGSACRTAR